MDYRREIDGLRAFAVLSVILFHATFQTFGVSFKPMLTPMLANNNLLNR